MAISPQSSASGRLEKQENAFGFRRQRECQIKRPLHCIEASDVMVDIVLRRTFQHNLSVHCNVHLTSNLLVGGAHRIWNTKSGWLMLEA